MIIEIGKPYKFKGVPEFVYSYPYTQKFLDEKEHFIDECVFELKTDDIFLVLEVEPSNVNVEKPVFDFNYKILANGKIGWYTKYIRDSFEKLFEEVPLT